MACRLSTHIRLGNLRPGDHAVSVFATEAEHWSRVASYVQNGLSGDERVVLLFAADDDTDAREHLEAEGVSTGAPRATGQLRFASAGDESRGPALAALLEEERTQAARRHHRLRITADAPQPSRTGPIALHPYRRFECDIDALVETTGGLALCHYDERTLSGSARGLVLHQHELIVSTADSAAAGGVFVEGAPPTLSLVGELDLAAAPALGTALTALADAGRRLDIHAGRLGLLDASCARLIHRAARQLDHRAGIVLHDPGPAIVQVLGVVARPWPSNLEIRRPTPA